MKSRFFAFLLVPVMLMLLITLAGVIQPGSTAHAAALDDPNPAGVPDNLRVPAGEVLVTDGVTSDGYNAVQDYTCLASGGTYAWVNTGPDATLQNLSGFPISTIHHTAVAYGPGFTPQWSLNGSFVAGSVVARSPLDGTIPQLLLQSVPDSNTPGPFDNVNYIQRLNTSGGLAPTDTCDANSVDAFEGIPYSAHYYFYAPQN